MRLLLLPACMNAQNVMEEWEVSPFDDGFDGLRDLQSRRFSGAVEAGGSWLFLRDGEPLAVVDDLEVDPRPGEVDAFEGASGRAHEAADRATASLAAMLALDGDVRGQYFTEDTPLSTVHETLSDGGFTGYVELSENVLSGDYYVVYEDGDEDYLGILGSSNRLITDDEAQSKAEGEVGIYSVVAVSFPDIEIPAAESSTTDAAGTVAAGATGAGEAADSTAVDDPGGPDIDPDPEPGLAAGAGAGSDTEPDADEAPGASAEADEHADPEPTIEEEIPDPDAETPPESEPEPAPEPEREAGTGAATDAQGGNVTDPSEQPDVSPEPMQGGGPNGEPRADASADLSEEPTEPSSSGGLRDPAGNGTEQSDAGGDGPAAPDLDGVTTRAVPSLDPERTGRAESSRATEDVQAPDTRAAAGADPGPEPDARSDPAPEPAQQRASGGEAESESADARVEAVREEYEQRIADLESELESLREERDRLRRRVSELEAAGAESASGGGGTSLSPADALAGTSLFVREGTRGEATLEDAHDGRTDRETLAKNLRIEYHTQFDDETATVEGEPFESWLRSTPRYDFVEWLIEDLLFEIQSTGSASGLRHLYDAIPLIDRVGFDDAVSVGEGEEGREITFDVVARNRMGEPLIAADIDDSRDPTRAESIRPLIGDAEDVCMDHDTLAATFAVTSSYFEPDALDAAREATSGSLLGREKYRSYVKLARKNGFHLCLVESREDSFHLAVPEL